MIFVLWRQFISTVLLRTDIVVFANIHLHLTVVAEDQSNDLLFN
jgi:hypothetical protein